MTGKKKKKHSENTHELQNYDLKVKPTCRYY